MLEDLLANVFVALLVSPALWVSGRIIVGKDKAKLGEAVLITILGTIIGSIVGGFCGPSLLITALVAQFIVWLALIRHFFDCGWGRAFAIGIVAVILYQVVFAILMLLGIGLLVGMLTW